MTDRRDLSGPDADLAAEHALSLLEGDARLAAERRMQTDPAFRAEVEAWQTSLADTLGDEFAETQVHPSVKTRLMGRLFGTAAPRRVWPWQVFGLGSFAAAAVLAVVALGPVLNPPPPIPQDLGAFNVAAADGSLVLLAALDHVTRTLYFTRAEGAPPPGRVLELWAIQGGNAPVSLGVLPDVATGTAQIPPGIGAEGLTLAISDEPPGGSPTGAPTGTVLAVGEVVEL